MDEVRNHFFVNALLDETKKLNKMLQTYQFFAKWNFPLPPHEALQTDESFYCFLREQLKLRKLPYQLLYYALNQYVKPAKKPALSAPTPVPTYSKFIPLCTTVDKLYARSTEAPDPRNVRTIATLHKAVLLYHGHFDYLKKHLCYVDEFQADYIQFRSRMRALRFDYYVYGAVDDFLEKANYDALKAACLTRDIVEILSLKSRVVFGKSDDMIALAEYIQYKGGQHNAFVRTAIAYWQYNLYFSVPKNPYVQALLDVMNERIKQSGI